METSNGRVVLTLSKAPNDTVHMSASDITGGRVEIDFTMDDFGYLMSTLFITCKELCMTKLKDMRIGDLFPFLGSLLPPGVEP